MELLKTIVNLMFVLQFVLPIAVNNLVVFGSEISCEVSEAANGSCVRTVNPCIREHDGELQQCFGEGPTIVPSNCPADDEGYHIGNDCPNYRNPDVHVNSTNVVPVFVHLTAYPIYPGPGQLYGLRVSWSPSPDFATDTNLQGYQVKLKYDGDRTPTAGCVCKNYTETEHNFTLYYGESRQLRVTVTSYPGAGDANAYEKVFSGLKSCYDLPYDPIHCGPPRYGKPSNIQLHSTLTSNGTMSAKISWGPPQFDASTYPYSSEYPTPSTYYLYLYRWIPSNNELEPIDKFIANNTEVVSIHSLNITDDLYLLVQAYVNCSGYGSSDDGFHGCGSRPQVSIPFPMSTSLASVTASVISASKSATTMIASEPRSHGSYRNMLPAVIGGAVGFIVVATVIITGLFVIRLRGYRLRGYNCHYSPLDSDPSPPDPSPPEPLPEPPPVPPLEPPSDLKTVFLLYSAKSPEEERKVILQLIYKSLRQYAGIAVTIPEDYTRAGGSPAMWLSNSMHRASVVLCVCNATFKSEWNGIRPSSVEVNTLKELVSGTLYRHSRESSLSSKYATVCLKQSDYHCIPTLLSGTSRFLVTETDKMVAFTTETPRYAPK